MTCIKSKLKTFFSCALALILVLIVFAPISHVSVFADSKLTIADLLGNYYEGSTKDQEITDQLDFSTDFGDTEEMGSKNGWSTPTYTNITFEGSVEVNDFTSSETFEYGSNNVAYSTIGTDGTPGNKYGLFFKTTASALAGIESSAFPIPAQSIYVLTFKVKIGKVSNSRGINAKIIDTTTNKTISMASIKTEGSYKTFAFLIRGNEFDSRNIKIQFLWGNVTENNGEYTSNKEIGYAVVDSIRLFSVNASQYEDLASVSENTKVDLFTSNINYMYITNGDFSFSANQKWNLAEPQSITDLRPSGWIQETVVTDEADRVAHYGIINVNTAKFNSRMSALGETLVNPGTTNASLTNNNVLLVYNKSATYQTIKSSEITLAKNSYYEISFKFNTPATKTSFEEEDNSLSFYILGADNKEIYSRKNMFSYTEWEDDVNDWATFRIFIKTNDTDKKVKFAIEFGTEDATQEGYAYVDEVTLIKKTSATAMFENTLEDTYILKGEGTEYLATGALSFADLSKLDPTNTANRALATYDYSTVTTSPDDDDDEDPITPPDTSNSSYLWYVIPSVLLGVCTIFGLIIFYAQKFKSKIKIPKKAKKNSYDRKRTLEKQVAQREKIEKTSEVNIEKQLKSVRSKIEKLEANYEKYKSNRVTLKEYIKKREKLQNEELKLKNKLK